MSRITELSGAIKGQALNTRPTFQARCSKAIVQPPSQKSGKQYVAGGSPIDAHFGQQLNAKSSIGGASVQALLRPAVARRSGRIKGGARLNVSAVFERFTERAIKAVMLAQQESKALGHPEVGTEHILVGLVLEENARQGLLASGITGERARSALADINASKARTRGNASEVPFSLPVKQVFEAALQESKKMSMSYITPEHIAVALLSVSDQGITTVLKRLGVAPETLKAEAIKRLKTEMESGGKEAVGVGGRPAKGAAAAQGKGEDTKTPTLDEFCMDFTQLARDNKIDPVIGREKEVERVAEILARRTKNNPILLGEPGVGKTAIAEGLACQIANDTCAEFLKGKRVMALDVGLLMAGAKERGELETRVTTALAEIKAVGNIVLVIDEIHTLVGAGGRSNGGGLDIANLLKPELARGGLQCIGATTLDEHRRHIESDPALERRFQPILVGEPTEDEAYDILLGLRDKYEKHHCCRITDAAIRASVTIAARYISDRFMPDKCIDLMDEAGSRARIQAYLARKARREAEGEEGTEDSAEANEVWTELRQVVEAKQAAVREALYEEASLLCDREQALWERVAALGDLDATTGHLGTVDVAEIESVASIWTGIPVEQITKDETDKLNELEDILHQRVIGQEEAVSAIARSLRRSRVGLKDPSRPIASMIFSGPTGVGKTELTKALADKYFGSEENIVRLDMSEYMERHTVSRLIGPPPGYVGYGEAGLLTEPVRRKPYTVVLIDEVEKAHPDVLNVLLQVIEDGMLTDSTGRTVSFKNTLIIMTSNVGSRVIEKGGNMFGFTLEDDSQTDGGAYMRMRENVLDELKDYFTPELLNRLDEVVVFKQLTIEEVQVIAHIMLKETATRLAEKGIGLQLTEGAMKRVIAEGYDKSYGARPLRRTITRLVLDTLAEALLSEELKAGDVAHLHVDAEGQLCLKCCNYQDCTEMCMAQGDDKVAFTSADSVQEVVEYAR